MYEDELFEEDSNNDIEKKDEKVEEEEENENEGDLDFEDLGIEYED